MRSLQCTYDEAERFYLELNQEREQIDREDFSPQAQVVTETTTAEDCSRAFPGHTEAFTTPDLELSEQKCIEQPLSIFELEPIETSNEEAPTEPQLMSVSDVDLELELVPVTSQSDEKATSNDGHASAVHMSEPIRPGFVAFMNSVTRIFQQLILIFLYQQRLNNAVVTHLLSDGLSSSVSLGRIARCAIAIS